MVLWNRVDAPLPRIVASLHLAGVVNEVDNLDSKEESAIGDRVNVDLEDFIVRPKITTAILP